MTKPPDTLQPLSPVSTGMVFSGRLLSPVRCVLFDIYGTLFISGAGDISHSARPDHLLKGLARILERHGLHQGAEITLEAFYHAIDQDHRRKKAAGIDFPEVDIIEIWQQALGPDLPEGFSLRDFAVDYELMANPVWPMPNLGATVSGLRDRNLFLGIISNAQFYTPYLFQWFLGKPLAELGIDPDLVFWSFRHGIAKPSPTLFQKATNSLRAKGIQPQQTLFVGNDMRNDILPAIRAGFATALFAGDARSLRLRTDDKACSDLAPDLVITDLLQILDHL